MNEHLESSEASENLRGAGWMTLASIGYVVNDAFIKLATDDLTLFQAIFIRGLFTIGLLVVLLRQRGELSGALTHLDRPISLRVLMECVGTAFYLSALTRLPIAGLIAVLQVVPLLVTFVAARLLREAVSWHRVIAVVIGFVGVILIVRPGSDDFNPWFIAGLAVVITVVIREIATTNIGPTTPSMVVSLFTAIAITLMGLAGSLFQGWNSLGQQPVLLLLAGSAFLTLGYVASVNAVRVGDISFTAPFRYTVLVFAIILQVVVFQDVPDALTFIGTGIIAAAGIYAFRREQRVTV